jgi:hypothetical protein
MTANCRSAAMCVLARRLIVVENAVSQPRDLLDLCKPRLGTQYSVLSTQYLILVRVAKAENIVSDNLSIRHFP